MYYIYDNADQYRELLRVSAKGVIMMFLISLMFPLLNGMQNIYLYRSMGAVLSYRDGFFLTAASTLANQLPISGGIVSKGVYLKHKYNISYTKFASSTFALYFCFVSVNGFIGMATLLGWVLVKKTFAPPVLFAAYTMMIAALLVFQLPFGRIRMPEKIQILFHQAVEGWALISKNQKLLLKLGGLQIVLVFLLSFRYWLAFHMLSQNVTIGQTLIFASATILTQLASISPGGLGVREAIVGAVAATLGFDPGIGVVAVGLDRLVSTVVIMLTGWISILVLGKQLTGVSRHEKTQ